MKCPHCKKDIPFPTERQLLCWIYIYVYGMSHRQAAARMGVSVDATKHLICNMRKISPALAPKNRGKCVLIRFNPAIHSNPKMRF